ncbi:MAG: SGNH/GDSL hydrolase family protein [Planctomycetaceae bacterium]
MRISSVLTLILAVCCSTSAFAQRKQNALSPIEDVEGLPRVLLIGDSISIGYTLPTRKNLEGVANLHRISTNGGPTTRGLASLDQWIGDSKWDVIHFNWGLHDLKYIDDKGGLADVEAGEQQVPIEEYEKNLDELVQKLKKTGAKLIWCSTTPVPEGAKGRVPGDEVKYNEAAQRVMKKHDVLVNDLWRFASEQPADIQLPANVHYTPAGSGKLADHVAGIIKEQLK